MAITYGLEDKLYINLTNRCTNDCEFCVRNFKDGVGDYNLWLDKEPTTREIINNIGDASAYNEIIFCGYGEPMIRLEEIKEISNYLKNDYPKVPIRINSNGQANLIHNRNILPEISDLIDSISISLNAHNSKSYQKICKSTFSDKAFPAIIEFISEAKKYISEVRVSVVDYPEVDIDSCSKLAKKLNVPLKIRRF
ncbi:TatD family-associated radical SAM protein [Orenia metallireducens]|jgi:TatD family-associated radical SAM protein|uniref:Radical SAM protein, TatD family-associated n=1 Tax=Orenia metallireducens TaxID=1413210 RepID=A0A285GYQ0_9FIRM|nr:TatD family nuclease-associated radical SAM protein [Orenia metallireducens]PRX26456.1 TatD family-associated radical SAM protein [Orenia metallireducens]SNY28750.1 radical SAM protein, TatD family-associated [Orenia metallireducens]